MGMVVHAARSPATEPAAEPSCFDVLISARIIRQTPTNVPDCDDCIVMSWPWIVDLDVEHMMSGRVPSGALTVLTLQHTYFRTDLGARRWWLRRNQLGGFNVLRHDEGVRPPRCPADASAARPYVRPAEGRTLEDLRREGEERYGSRPDARLPN